MVPNDESKSVNIDKISTALHVYYLNLNVQIQAYSFECTPCSDAISGSMNRVFDIKSGHDFGRNSIQAIHFQIDAYRPSILSYLLLLRDNWGHDDDISTSGLYMVLMWYYVGAS